MKSEDIVKALGSAEDKFIEESAGTAEKNSDEGKTIVIRLPKAKAMKKWAGTIAAVLAVCVAGGAILSSGLFTGFSKSAAAAETDYIKNEVSNYSLKGSYKDSAAYDVSEGIAEEYLYSGAYEYEEAQGTGGTSSLLQSSVTSLGKDNLKLIYTADMSVQTTDYTQAEQDIKALVEAAGGYFESISFDNGSYYSSSTYRYGYYKIRIPSDKYTDFISSVGESCHVVNLSQSVQDVGEQYSEIEGRLETLYTKQERLQELLKTAGNLSDIIELESALSDTEYQIDSYKGNLRHYDSLIGYSTVNLSIEQVVRTDTGITQDNSFGARIKRSFTRGLSNVADSFEDFIIWISYNFVGIIICAAVLIFLVKFRPVRKILKKIKDKKNSENDD